MTKIILGFICALWIGFVLGWLTGDTYDHADVPSYTIAIILTAAGFAIILLT